MATCKLCEQWQYIHNVQMEGRLAAKAGKKRSENPHKAALDVQYWEYGWIEESFMSELEEHRAVMDWTGVQLFDLSQVISELEKDGHITNAVSGVINGALETICGKLAEKLKGD